MNAVVNQQEFFAPSNNDAVDYLLLQHSKEVENIKAVSSFVSSDEMRLAIGYYLNANKSEFSRRVIPRMSEIFDKDKALSALDAAYWQKALNLTDVMDFMPNERRYEWHEQIKNHEVPSFDEETVRPTLESLLSQRMDFLAEMVDGIFQGLSHNHVTNQPEGFSKRMILEYVFDRYGTTNYKMSGYVHDLRFVISKFMGRGQPKHYTTDKILSQCRRNTGEWYSIDGGAFRVRAYMKGTCHIEVHPDMAWRLNQILAHLYPSAIPDKNRKPPVRGRQLKEFQLYDNLIPFEILDHFSEIVYDRNDKHVIRSIQGYYKADNQVKRRIRDIMASLGGVELDSITGSYKFDYNPEDVLAEVFRNGKIPDQKSYQFYPTPKNLAEEVVTLAGVKESDQCLEPSAGQGAIADLLPKDRTTCIEISKVHCDILESKGYNTVQADFMEWNDNSFDVIVMNPPFSEGRAQAHVEHAADLLNAGGRLVAILPSSMKDKNILPGMDVSWSGVYDNEFDGTSVSVVILKAVKEQ